MTSGQISKRLEPLITVLLGLAIFPSLTALSTSYQDQFPGLARFTGPLNPVKITLPLLVLFLAIEWRKLPRKLALWFLASAVVGTLATVISGLKCSFPSALLREWFVILSGFWAGLVFLVLNPSRQKWVATFWFAAIAGLALFDFAWPASIDWLYNTVFDPNTRYMDWFEVGGGWSLTGVFGRQSMAKLLAWTPWLFLAVHWKYSDRWKTPAALIGLGIGVLTTGAILATTQRGPFLAALVGWAGFAFHQWLRMRNRKLALASAVAGILAIALMFTLVPSRIWKPRLDSLFGRPSTTAVGHNADRNREWRINMTRFSLHVIATTPLGSSCLEDAEFKKFGAYAAHSHNLFLQQLRERGWFWGGLHIVLWIVALLGAWSSRTYFGSALFAGLVTVVISGMFDHPWQVLNHSVLLSVYLALGLLAWVERNKPVEVSPGA